MRFKGEFPNPDKLFVFRMYPFQQPLPWPRSDGFGQQHPSRSRIEEDLADSQDFTVASSASPIDSFRDDHSFSLSRKPRRPGLLGLHQHIVLNSAMRCVPIRARALWQANRRHAGVRPCPSLARSGQMRREQPIARRWFAYPPMSQGEYPFLDGSQHVRYMSSTHTPAANRRIGRRRIWPCRQVSRFHRKDGRSLVDRRCRRHALRQIGH